MLDGTDADDLNGFALIRFVQLLTSDKARLLVVSGLDDNDGGRWTCCWGR